jgi:hypothetical protein
MFIKPRNFGVFLWILSNISLNLLPQKKEIIYV